MTMIEESAVKCAFVIMRLLETYYSITGYFITSQAGINI